ncbi:MAG: YciI family protein [Pseudomonadota bacterium]|nr:YciI family protein [Pseudomonadota bacterium]
MYAVICFDRPGSALLRDANRDAHMDYLGLNVDKIEFAGPLKDDENASSTGAIFILNVPTREDAEAFMNGDAFNKAGVYESVMIRSFRKVFPQ